MRLSILFCLLVLSASAQEKLSHDIRLNQLGFYPNGKKLAVILNERADRFQIYTADHSKKVFEGKTSKLLSIDYSPKKTRVADFSSLQEEGTYVIVVPEVGESHSFEIRKDVFVDVAKASLKFFYYQRFSTSLPETYAGKWARRSSPSHSRIVIHPSAVSASRADGSIVSSTRGWIDAGDYNKYVVNSGITTSTLLSAYEDLHFYFKSHNVNIPESGNQLPDILDEVLWNLRWMMSMQDPADGGVYHKCTNAKFSGMVNPDQETTPRYMVQKSTGAALNLAAVSAQASRVFREYEKQLPGFSDSCLNVARSAWNWAKQNPAVLYDQKKMNEQFDPDVVTGEYGDRMLTDEWVWAAAEMFVATKDETYLKDQNFFPGNDVPIPTWNQVLLLGYYRLLRSEKDVPAAYKSIVGDMRKRILTKANDMENEVERHPYQVVMGLSKKDFVWGSNAVAANQAIFLLQAYYLYSDKKFLDLALGNLDYILGRNGTGYSFVTGHGDKTPMHPHHRPSEADGIKEPIPGMLVGGPNPGMQDKCKYASSIPEEAYTDEVCSYASNEVAINWNAPLVYLTAAMESFQKLLEVK
jgi:endoglucanase